METKEKIKVLQIGAKDGTSLATLYQQENSRCGKDCSPEVVERDKFAEWERTFHRDRFGKSE